MTGVSCNFPFLLHLLDNGHKEEKVIMMVNENREEENEETPVKPSLKNVQFSMKRVSGLFRC